MKICLYRAKAQTAAIAAEKKITSTESIEDHVNWQMNRRWEGEMRPGACCGVFATEMLDWLAWLPSFPLVALRQAVRW